MTKYTKIECDGCRTVQDNLINDMESNFLTLERGPSRSFDGYKPRHLCNECSLYIYDVIWARKNGLRSKDKIPPTLLKVIDRMNKEE